MSRWDAPLSLRFASSAGSVVSRTAAVALLLILGLVAWASLVPFWSSYLDNEERIAEMRAALPRLRAIANYNGAMDATRDKTAIGKYLGDFLAGRDDALMIAELQTRLRTLVVARASEFSSAQALPPRSLDGLTYLGVRMQLKGQLRDIQAILHTIETTAPFLFVERVQLRLEEVRILPSVAQVAAPRVLADIEVFGAKWPLAEQGSAP
jgi:general secretion pathway protein M